LFIYVWKTAIIKSADVDQLNEPGGNK
jgi:hypothetical protein